MTTFMSCGRLRAGLIAATLVAASCSDRRGSSSEPLDPANDIEVRTGALAAASSGLATLTCNGQFVYDLDAPNRADWTRIQNNANKPAFIVVDDKASTTGTTDPTQPTNTTTNAVAFFHNNPDPSMKAVKVLKYIPMNYAQVGDSETDTACGSFRNKQIHNTACDNSPINADCTQVAITTRISNALASGFDGVFFDEAPERNDRLNDPQNTPAGLTAPDLHAYVDSCAGLVKATDASKLVIINSGSLPQDPQVFNSRVDIVALENNAVTDVFNTTKLAAFGAAPERWAGVLKTSAFPDAGVTDGETDTETNMTGYRNAGGWWYYETARYSVLPDWLETELAFGDQRTRPQCMGFPSNDSQDGKFTLVTGKGLTTVESSLTQFVIELPATENHLTVEVYDGEAGGFNDIGTENTCFQLFSTPNGEMMRDTTQTPLASASSGNASSGLGDKAWSVIYSGAATGTVAPSQNRIYRLDALLSPDCVTQMSVANVQNRFKVRTNGQVSVQFGDLNFAGTDSTNYAAGSFAATQPIINSPDYLYDGSFTFNIDVKMQGNLKLTNADADKLTVTAPEVPGQGAGVNDVIAWSLTPPPNVSIMLPPDIVPSGDYESRVPPARKTTADINMPGAGTYKWNWTGVQAENAVVCTVQSSPTQYAVYPVPAHRLPTSDAVSTAQWASQLTSFTPTVLGSNAACPTPGNRTVVSTVTDARNVLLDTSSAFAILKAQLLAARLNVSKSAGRTAELQEAHVYGRSVTVASVLADADAAIALGPTGTPAATIQELTLELNAVNAGDTTYIPERVAFLPDGSADTDGDGVRDDGDNCVGVSNASQADFKLDGIGDACDPVPQLRCVTKTGGTGFTAFFGYTKAGSDAYFLRTNLNRLAGTTDKPITLFVAGGQPIAFSAHSTGSTITWTLGNRSVTATATSPQCPGTELSSLPFAQRAVLYAGQWIHIGDRCTIQACADIVSAGANTSANSVNVNAGVHTADIYSSSPVFLADSANVGMVRSNGTVTLQNPNDTPREGIVSPAGLTLSPPAWSMTFPGGTHNPVSPQPDGPTVTIGPGSYGTVTVPARATLALSASGTYFFDSFSSDPGGKILLPTGPVQIYVQNQLTFRGAFLGGTPGTNLVLAYFGINDVALEAPITLATFAAPNAHVFMGTGAPQTFLGHFFAKQIDLRSAVTAGLPQ